MEETILNAKPRKIFGKKVKKLRREGQIPAILYGHEVKAVSLSINTREFDKVFEKVGTSALADLKINDEKPKKVLIHEPQLDPKTLTPLHVDFYQVKMTEKIQTEIPLKFVREPLAVKEQGGTLVTPRDTIDVECLPDALIHEIEVDVSSLDNFEKQIKISDLNIPKDIEILNDKEETIASVTPPMSEEEIAELEAPVEEKVEEVEEVEKKEGEEGVEGETEAPAEEGKPEETQEQQKVEENNQ